MYTLDLQDLPEVIKYASGLKVAIDNIDNGSGLSLMTSIHNNVSYAFLVTWALCKAGIRLPDECEIQLDGSLQIRWISTKDDNN